MTTLTIGLAQVRQTDDFNSNARKIFEYLDKASAAGNTIWFASCNACLEHQNSQSMIAAPDGQVLTQSEQQREELVTAAIDVDRATRAMFKFDMEGCAELLFADTVQRDECASALTRK